MKKILLLLISICLITAMLVSCADMGSINNKDTGGDSTSNSGTTSAESGSESNDTDTDVLPGDADSNNETSDVTADTSDHTSNEKESAETEETLAPEISENWPAERIKGEVGEEIPAFRGAFESVELYAFPYAVINPGVEIVVCKVDPNDVENYKNILLENDFVGDGEQYIKFVSNGTLSVVLSKGSEQGDLIIDVRLYKTSGSLNSWPAEAINEALGEDIGLPSMIAESFELESDVDEIYGIVVRTAIVVCYDTYEGALNDYKSTLVSQGYGLSEGVYQKLTDELSISVSVTETSYYAEGSVMVTVSVTDNLSVSHKMPTNIKVLYNDTESRYTATKIDKDYMLTVKSGESTSSYFYKYDASAKNWTEYMALGGSDWSSTGVVKASKLSVEETVFGFVVDSNMVIFTDSGETESCCGVAAKKYVFEYEQGMTLYKLQHPDSGLILEVGVIELNIATDCVTEYNTNITGFEVPIP